MHLQVTAFASSDTELGVGRRQCQLVSVGTESTDYLYG